MRIDAIFVLSGLIWLFVGMVFGTWMGINEQFHFANTHAHVGLLGFVASVLFGLIYRAWPAMESSRLALPQYGVYQVGVVMLLLGKYTADNGGHATLAPPGSALVILGAALFAWIFIAGMKSSRLTLPQSIV